MVYIGQARDTSYRMPLLHDSFPYRPDTKSLHYHALKYSNRNKLFHSWVQPQNTYTRPGLHGQSELLLNLYETRCALTSNVNPDLSGSQASRKVPR